MSAIDDTFAEWSRRLSDALAAHPNAGRAILHHPGEYHLLRRSLLQAYGFLAVRQEPASHYDRIVGLPVIADADTPKNEVWLEYMDGSRVKVLDLEKP